MTPKKRAELKGSMLELFRIANQKMTGQKLKPRNYMKLRLINGGLP